jgi:hypothetical protein
MVAAVVPAFGAKLNCLGNDPQTVTVYDNQGCSSTPKQTIAVGVDTCVSISQFNISVKADCSSSGGALISASFVMTTVTLLVFVLLP